MEVQYDDKGYLMWEGYIEVTPERNIFSFGYKIVDKLKWKVSCFDEYGNYCY